MFINAIWELADERCSACALNWCGSWILMIKSIPGCYSTEVWLTWNLSQDYWTLMWSQIVTGHCGHVYAIIVILCRLIFIANDVLHLPFSAIVIETKYSRCLGAML